MLDKIRAQGGSWGVKVGAGIIVLVFIFWGYGTQNMEGGIYALKVNGRPISMDDYERAYRQRQEQSRQPLPSRILADQVKDDLVERELLAQFAEDADIHASTQELADTIKSIPWLKDEAGKFIGREAYLKFLKDRDMSVGEFERNVTHDLRVGKARTLIESAAGKVTDEDVKEEFRTRNDKVDLDYVVVDRAALAEALRAKPIPKAEIDEWTRLNPGKVESLYAEQKDARWTAPAKVDLLQITVRKPSALEKDASKAEKAKLSSQQALEKAKADWAEAAKLYAEGAAWEKTGKPREFARRDLPAAIADAVFAAETPAGKTAEPKLIETPTSYVIARVVKRTDEKVTELDEAVTKQIVEEQIRDAKASGEVETVAKDIFERLKKGEKLSTLAEQRKLAPKSTGLFPAIREEIPGIPDSDPALVATAFRLTKPGEVLEINGAPPKVGDSWVLAVLKEHKAPSDADFEQQKMWISVQLQRDRSMRAFEAWKAKRIKESKIVESKFLPSEQTS